MGPVPSCSIGGSALEPLAAGAAGAVGLVMVVTW